MGASQRLKGQRGENELAGLLRDWLGDDTVNRLLGASRDGGHDIGGLTLDGIALEVKRHETRSLGVWWAQAEKQAEAAGKRPVLAYRANRQPWRFMVEMDGPEFCDWLRNK